jgi:hypothetical protein
MLVALVDWRGIRAERDHAVGGTRAQSEEVARCQIRSY